MQQLSWCSSCKQKPAAERSAAFALAGTSCLRHPLAGEQRAVCFRATWAATGPRAEGMNVEPWELSNCTASNPLRGRHAGRAPVTCCSMLSLCFHQQLPTLLFPSAFLVTRGVCRGPAVAGCTEWLLSAASWRWSWLFKRVGAHARPCACQFGGSTYGAIYVWPDIWVDRLCVKGGRRKFIGVVGP